MPKSEQWREVPGSEGWYEVSDRGRIRSYASTRSRTARLAVPRLVGSAPGKHPYARVRMSRPRDRQEYVHRLVLLAFVGPCPEGLECAHLNGDPADNRRENLAWVTVPENASHREVHGTVTRGSRSPQAKVTEADVKQMRHRVASKRATISQLAREYGMTYQGVWLIVKRKNFKHVPTT